MPSIIASAKAYATEQEICDILREELGTYLDPGRVLTRITTVGLSGAPRI